MTESGESQQDAETDSAQSRERRRIPWLGLAAVGSVVVGVGMVSAVVAGALDGVLSCPGMPHFALASRRSELAGACLQRMSLLGLVLGLASIVLGLAKRRSLDSLALGMIAVLLALMTMSVAAVMPAARESPAKGLCLANVKRMALAIQMYAVDQDGAFPPAANWPGALLSYGLDEEHLVCPTDPDFRGSYAYNQALIGMLYDAMADPGHVVAIFESDAAWLASGGPELLPEEPRHLHGDNYGFADGHATWWNRERVLSADPSELRWEPVLGEGP